MKDQDAAAGKPAIQQPEQAGHPSQTMVVGIGASAGGLKTLQIFFEAVAPDLGVAFVVIVHLHPEYRSEMAALLAIHTPMPVTQVTETVPLEPNHIYVIPPNQQLFAANNQLSLAPFSEPRGLRTPIDYFFNSLAETHGDGFAIVLSGGGSDGTSGLKSIKEQGGLVLVQDPLEAEYDSMPRSAIATGLADLVLPVRELAARLPALVRNKSNFQAAPQELAVREEATLRQILTHLRSRTGHDFSQYKRATVLRRIERRIHVSGKTTFADYLVYLQQSDDEVNALFADMLISVTAFFRDPASFATLAGRIIPELFANRTATEQIRIWVPGCATGEEAYSLAMILLEQIADAETYPEIQIFASDLDEGALTTAREGRYLKTIEADVSEERLQRFFTKEGSYYRIKKEVRKLVLFANHSLLADPPFSRLDLISCRNLLIYLDRPLQQQIFKLFHYALLPGRYLFLGSSEHVEGAAMLFRVVNRSCRIYQRRTQTGEQRPTLPDLLLTPAQSRPPLRREPRSESYQDADFHHKVLEEYGPPSLLVDADFNTVHLSETVGRYLQPPGGRPTYHITSLVRPELQLELYSALQQAFEHHEASLSPLIPVQFDGARHGVQLMVRPLRRDATLERLTLVVFIEGPPLLATPVDQPAEPDADETVRQLRMGLQQSQQRLQTTREEHEVATEELRASNEELQSINEEHRSATEELETSKEELQSMNEELQTVNLELKNKLEEISRAHSDLQNFMTVTEIGTLFLDLDLRIRRFTPRIAALFNLVDNDLGRPVTLFNHQLLYPMLQQDAETVLQNLRPIEREVWTKDAHCYLVRLRPYRTVEDKIDGVVITFVDITEREKAKEALQQSEEYYRLLVEGVQEYAIFLLDMAGRIATWNSGAQQIFQYEGSEVIGQPVAILLDDPDQLTDFPLTAMATATRGGKVADDNRYRRKDGSRFWTSGVTSALYYPNGTLRGFAKVLRDNTERKQSEDQLHQLNAALEARVVQVHNLASALTLAEQAERRRISQILHDDLQQLLYAIQIHVEQVAGEIPEDTAAKQLVEQACNWLADAVQVTRRLTVDLSPPILKEEGLVDALTWLAIQMDDANDLHVTIVAAHAFPIVNQDIRVLLFQIIRELLFNVVKHALVEEATVTLRDGADGQLIITVSDEGCGFDVETIATNQAGGFGLFSVRERLGLFGGAMAITSAPGAGTQVTITIARSSPTRTTGPTE